MTSSLLQQSEEAHEDYQKLVDCVALGKELDVYKGKQLWRLKANNLYKKAIGEGGIDTWNDFLKLPEIGLSTSEANRLMDIYEQFVVKLEYSEKEIAQAKTKALHYLLPVAKRGEVSKETMDELLESAQHLTLSQFKEELYDAKTEYKGERTYTYMVMCKCNETGNMQKVHGLSSELIVKRLEIIDNLPEIL